MTSPLKRSRQILQEPEMIINGRYQLDDEEDLAKAEKQLELAKMQLDSMKSRMQKHDQTSVKLAIEAEESRDGPEIRKEIVAELFAVAAQSPVVSAKLTRPEHAVLNELRVAFRATTNPEEGISVTVYDDPSLVKCKEGYERCFICGPLPGLVEDRENEGKQACKRCYRQIEWTHDLFNLLVVSRSRSLTSDEAQLRRALISELSSGSYHQTVNNVGLVK